MADGPPPNLRSLQDRLRNHSRAVELPYGRVQRLLGVLVVGELMRDDELGVVKGGSNLEVRIGIAATRASSDLDVVRTRSLEQFRDSLEDALATGWEGFTGRLIDRGPIGAPVPDAYRPYRLEAKLAYGAQFGLGTITVEVAVEEVDALETFDTVESADGLAVFDAVGLPRPRPIRTLPLRQQIAQKLHACTTPNGDGWINDRAHDLVDLQLADRSYNGSLGDVRRVCERLFVSRRRQAWPPDVTIREGWGQRYAEEAEGLDVLEDIADAIAWVNDYIRAIAQG